MPSKKCFNSKLVRLEVGLGKQLYVGYGILCFNSKLVRLEASEFVTLTDAILSFNSKLVRLEVLS